MRRLSRLTNRYLVARSAASVSPWRPPSATRLIPMLVPSRAANGFLPAAEEPAVFGDERGSVSHDPRDRRGEVHRVCLHGPRLIWW